MKNKLTVAPSPHINNYLSTSIMMFAVLVALVPAATSGVINFGIRALYIILIAMGSAYVFDIAFNYLMNRRVVWTDFSSLVTGLITALILPVKAPLYFPVIASFLAIVIFKGCFGGLGKNIFNPSAAARVILGLIFSGLSISLFTGVGPIENAMSPLSYYMLGDYSSIPIRSLFFGTAPGAIGTVSMICILIAGVVLMLFSITDFIIPICSLVGFIATAWIGKGAISIIPFLFSGSFMFVTMFMITDPTTSPLTQWGKLFYGLIFGVVAGLFRVYYVLGETGVFVAVLIANLLAPLLDKIFAPHPIGVKRRDV